MRKNFKKAERATAIPAKFGTASQARWIRRATLSGGTALAMLMGGMSANALWGDYYDTNTPMFAAGSVAFGVLPYYGLFHEKGESSRAIKAVYTDEPLAIVNNDLWNWSRSDGRWETRYTHGQLDTASWPISSPTTIDSPTPLSPVTSTNGSGITRTLVGNRGAALFNMSQSGAPVELRIPGAVIAQVMHQTEENPWVFWQFIVDGAAPESVGLMYDMSVLGQCAPDMSAADCHTQGSLKDPYGVWGTPTKPWDGAGSTDPESLFGYTLLGMSEVLIYPAAADRTCAVKNGDGPQNWPIVPEVRLEQLLSYIPDYLDKYAAYESAEAEWEALNDPDADTSDVDAAWDAAQVPFVEIFNLANKLGISYPDDFDLGDPLHPVYVGTRDFEASNVFVYTEGFKYDHHWNLDPDDAMGQGHWDSLATYDTSLGGYKYLSHAHDNDTSQDFYDADNEFIRGDHIAVEDLWCVAAHFKNDPDQPYTQNAWLMGYDSDNGNPYSAFQSWAATIKYQPVLKMLGYYFNLFGASGIGEDDSLSTADYLFEAEVYPDPLQEPDLVVMFDPIVDHIDTKYYQPCDSRPTPALRTDDTGYYSAKYLAANNSCNYKLPLP